MRSLIKYLLWSSRPDISPSENLWMKFSTLHFEQGFGRVESAYEIRAKAVNDRAD